MTQKNQTEQPKRQNEEKKQSFFYHYSQNNSFGTFDEDSNKGICPDVIIEAKSATDANERAQKTGLYFDGVDKGIDCPCCGDRWHEVDEGEGTVNPTIVGKPLSDIESGYYREEVYIHYLNGNIEYYKFKLSEEDRLKEEQLQADLEKSDNWRVYVYGIEGQDGWGKIAMNNKTGSSIVLGGKNFRCGTLMYNVDYRILTEERNPTEVEMTRLKSFAERMKNSRKK